LPTKRLLLLLQTAWATSALVPAATCSQEWPTSRWQQQDPAYTAALQSQQSPMHCYTKPLPLLLPGVAAMVVVIAALIFLKQQRSSCIRRCYSIGHR
jgi:hypothetical protein